MNGRASKQIRRDLRRVIGAEGVNVLDEHTQLLQSGIVPSLGALDTRLKAEEQRSDQHYLDWTQRDETIARQIRQLEDALFAFRVQSFWRRLNWLLFGI